MPPPSLAFAVSVTVPESGVPGSASVTVGATLSTRIELRVAEAVVFPARSVATARRSETRSATPAVAHEQPYDAVASEQASVHVLPPETRYWTVQVAMPAPASAAVPLSATFPDSEVPGLFSVAVVGAVLSIRTLTIADVVLKPALSTTISRASYMPSGYGVVSSAVQAYGAVVSMQTSVQVDAPCWRNWPVTWAMPLPAPSA